MKYCESYQSVTWRHEAEQMLSEKKWRQHTCFTQGHHKPSICKKLSKKLKNAVGKKKHNKKRYTCSDGTIGSNQKIISTLTEKNGVQNIYTKCMFHQESHNREM